MADSTTGDLGDHDEALLVAARTRPAAFGELYDRRHREVLAACYRRTGCPHAAAELMAETFAQAWASLHRFDPSRGRAMAWLLGIARNLHRGWLRQGRVRDRAGRRLGGATPVPTDDDLEQVEAMVDLTSLHAALVEALGALSPTLRDAVLLRIALDLPYDAVADRLGCSAGTARVRVSRGLDRLQSTLEAAM
jgi:RNA polymerase sigma-70 factor (ECF subfamily)